ncbi:hypothetical protein X975_06936, partial [Stegodyphus mimosarum]
MKNNLMRSSHPVIFLYKNSSSHYYFFKIPQSHQLKTQKIAHYKLFDAYRSIVSDMSFKPKIKTVKRNCAVREDVLARCCL